MVARANVVRISLKLVVLFVLHIFFHSSNSLRAEEYVVYGLSIPVKKVLRIDDSRTTVALLGKERIVPPEKVNATLLRFYLKTEGVLTAFQQGEILSAIQMAIKENDVESSVTLLEFYLASSLYSFEEKRENLLGLHLTTSSTPVFQALVKGNRKKIPQDVRALLFAFLSLDEQGWMRRNGINELQKVKDAYFDAIEFLVNRKLKEEGDSTNLRSLSDFLARTFTLSNPKVQQLTLLFDQLHSLRTLEPSLDRSLIYPFLEVSSHISPLSFLRILVVEKVHEFSEYAVAKGISLSPLLLLAELKAEERSERTQSIMVLALNSLEINSIEARANESFMKVISQESENSSLVRDAWNNFLQRSIQVSLAHDDIEGVRFFREYFSAKTNQEKQRYAELLVSEAIGLVRVGDRDGARKVLEGIERIPILTQLRLYLVGYYGSVARLFGLACGLFLLLLAVRFLYLKKPIFGFKGQKWQAEHLRIREDIAKGIEPQGVNGPSIQPLEHEYQQLLKTFGLKENATDNELKSAYRQLIKRVHPDVQSSASESFDTNADFLKLSAAYERIIELKSVLKKP